MRKYVNRKARRAAQKSMKTSVGDLQEMIKTAVKEVMDEASAEKGDGTEEGYAADSAADIVEAAIDAVNKSRKEGEGIAEDDAADLIAAVTDSEEGKGDVPTIDVGEILSEAIDAVNEKRKSEKADVINETDASDIIDAVSEIMGDQDPEEEAKGKKAAPAARERKSYTARRQPVQRKYSNIFLARPEGTGMKKKAIPADVMLARSIKCIDIWGRQDPERAAYFAQKNYGDPDMAREFKALSATGPTYGGYLIPEVYMDEIIELLYPKTVIFELGAQKVPLDKGNLNIPKMTAGTRATWRGEQRKISKTAPEFGNVKLSAKSLAAIVPQSRELLMSTSYSADALFANDLTRRMQLGLDYGGLYGTGGEFMPTGIYNNKEVEKIDVTKLDAAYASSTGVITADFPVYLRSIVMQKNVDDQKLGWAFNSMLEGFLMNMKTTTGEYIYRDEMQAGKLLGAPYRVSNQIPISSGGLTELFFVNWADLLIGDQMGMETYTTLEGSWVDDEGVTHNAFEENMAATRATMYDDIAVRHGESFIVAHKIKVM